MLSLNKKRPVAKNMTVAIAVHAKDIKGLSSLIFASDSRNTDGETQADDVRKISVVNFKNVPILIAESGCSGPSGMAVTELRKIATGTTITDPTDINGCVQEAVRMVIKQRLDSYMAGMSLSEQFRDRMENTQFNLMFGYLWRGEAFVFDCESIHFNIDARSPSNATIGAGVHLAKYFLAEFCLEKRIVPTAIAIATYIIRQVSKHTRGCGGPVQACALHAMEPEMAESWRKIGRPVSEAMGQDVCKQQIASYESEMDAMEKGIKERHHAAMIDMFNRISQKKMDQIESAMSKGVDSAVETPI